MRATSSSSVDKIPMYVLKEVSIVLCNSISYVFNLSLSNGVVPDNTKVARIIPVFKSGSNSLPSNYRPISILPCFSKILEKLVYNRLIVFIDKHNVISSSQFGFRKNYTTSMAAIDVVNFIIEGFNNKKYTLGLFLYLSKAFDTVNHSILLHKLSHYGIRGIAHDWFCSYLSNRKHFVHVNGVASTCNYVTCGVPQDSILGPLLFLLYINDLPACSKNLKFCLFADDTSILFKSDDPTYSAQIINKDMKIVCDWFNVNKLTLNTSKTHLYSFILTNIVVTKQSTSLLTMLILLRNNL